MKEMKLEIPAGCEVDKIETQDGHIVVTFKEKERQLPKSWEEFCEKFPIKDSEFYIKEDSSIGYDQDNYRCDSTDQNLLPNRATAEAILSLCQLVQLRNAYNGDWVLDWKNKDERKWMIVFCKNKIETTTCTNVTASELYFKTEELCDEFLRYFRPLINKLKPLYGIKEGGNE